MSDRNPHNGTELRMPRPRAGSDVTQALLCWISMDATQSQDSSSRPVNTQHGTTQAFSNAVIDDSRRDIRGHTNPVLATPQCHRHRYNQHHRDPRHRQPTHHQHQHQNNPRYHHQSTQAHPYNPAQSLNLDSQRQLSREILAMHSRNAQARAYHPSRPQAFQQPSFVRPPPGFNAPPQVPQVPQVPHVPSSISVAPPQGFSMPQPPPGISIPQPPTGTSMPQVPPSHSLSQPPNTSIPNPSVAVHPQLQPQPQQSSSSQVTLPSSLIRRLQKDQRRVTDMLDAINIETAQLKADKEHQCILFSNGLLYISNPTAWNTCDCRFCIGVRVLRQSKSLDAVGQRLWNDPEYAFWREYPRIHGFKVCVCLRCAQVEEDDKLEPDWTFWCGSAGRPSHNPALSAEARIELQQPPKFRRNYTAPQQPQTQNSLVGQLSFYGPTQSLFEMPEADIQHHYNSLWNAAVHNTTRNNGTGHHPPPPPLPSFMPQDSTPDVGPSNSGQYGAIGQPIVPNTNNPHYGTDHQDYN
ncbi:hypothetical protein TWF106_001430 [Orbilia oligospora]|uniref:Uncharacterized protein n=1 Tax=Orbilia oligospora TaxID=2813651 RepID=A0A6G1M9C7_ORBOL|nr:hypothetical protein TWF106_001430 [Orbilia oligospora]KAF3230558.1 hypothetical protein TWF191_009473 [Orbilia oligospora]KAF3249073.1 hypothetical protein TWF192_006021 [Orbilia oligospora]